MEMALLLRLLLLALASSAVRPSRQVRSLRAEEIALVQFDSRPPSNYWLAAAQWNNAYCKLHGHQFLYYTLEEECHYKEEPLASAWCKVKAMINAMEDFPDIQLFMYMDSDAVIDRQFSQISLNNMLGTMQDRLSWNLDQKPIVFNQDGPCWWCTFIMKIGYNMCLNAGTVVWYRHPISHDILWKWWNSTMDSYETNPIKRKFRLKWPWEQDRQMALYNSSSEFIQIASQPDRVFMQAKAGLTSGWCLSHLPEARCFVSHYCANARSKQVMRRLYQISDQNEDSVDFAVRKLHFDPF